LKKDAKIKDIWIYCESFGQMTADIAFLQHSKKKSSSLAAGIEFQARSYFKDKNIKYQPFSYAHFIRLKLFRDYFKFGFPRGIMQILMDNKGWGKHGPISSKRFIFPHCSFPSLNACKFIQSLKSKLLLYSNFF
jgi:hypothetical protein